MSDDETGEEMTLYVGDIVQPGPQSGIDGRLSGLFYRVVGFDKDGTVVLSLPYKDAKLTQPYIPSEMKGSMRDDLLREYDRRGHGKNWRPQPPALVH